jgi:hypothetical protein
VNGALTDPCRSRLEQRQDFGCSWVGSVKSGPAFAGHNAHGGVNAVPDTRLGVRLLRTPDRSVQKLSSDIGAASILFAQISGRGIARFDPVSKSSVTSRRLMIVVRSDPDLELLCSQN